MAQPGLNTGIVHFLSPDTDSWMSRRERMTVDNILCSTKECCWPRELNPQSPDHQSDTHPTEHRGRLQWLVFNTFWLHDFSRFYPLKCICIRKQIWSCCKKVKSQLHIYQLKETGSPPIPNAPYQDSYTKDFCSGKDIVFKYIWAWQPSWRLLKQNFLWRNTNNIKILFF